MRRSLGWAAGTAACALLALPAPALAFSYYQAGPSGTIHTSRPEIGAAVTPSPGDRLSASLALSGTIYPVTYADGGFYYIPPQPLAPGAYSGTLSIGGINGQGESYIPVTLPISFMVAPATPQQAPAVSLNGAQAVAALNAIRQAAGLPAVALSPALEAAARAHSAYLLANADLYGAGKFSLHEEPDPSRPEYTGTWPWDRDAAFGVTGATGEVLALDSAALTPQLGLADLMDTIWHRLGLLEADATAAGAGVLGNASESAFTLDFQFSGQAPLTAPAVTAYPLPGQTAVPTTFRTEDPNPLAGRTSASTAGYPVTLTFNDPAVRLVQVASATLSAGGAAVPVWEYDSQSWHDADPVYAGLTMGNSVALIAQKPLAPATTYTVDIAGTLSLADGSTSPFDQRWSFTTEPAPTAWVQGGELFVQGVDVHDLSVAGGAGGSPLDAAARAGDLVVLPDADGSLAVQAGGSALAPGSPPFGDIDGVAWAVQEIYAAWALGWVQGLAPGVFGPDAPLTQAQALTLLYRAEGQPFADITRAPADAPDWARAAEAWAVADGIVQPGEALASGADATRAQFTAWVVRALYPAAVDTPLFTDAAAIPASYADAVGWAEGVGLAEGIGGDAFDPQGSLTRAQAAVLLGRAFAGV